MCDGGVSRAGELERGAGGERRVGDGRVDDPVEETELGGGRDEDGEQEEGSESGEHGRRVGGTAGSESGREGADAGRPLAIGRWEAMGS